MAYFARDDSVPRMAPPQIFDPRYDPCTGTYAALPPELERRARVPTAEQGRAPGATLRGDTPQPTVRQGPAMPAPWTLGMLSPIRARPHRRPANDSVGVSPLLLDAPPPSADPQGQLVPPFVARARQELRRQAEPRAPRAQPAQDSGGVRQLLERRPDAAEGAEERSLFYPSGPRRHDGRVQRSDQLHTRLTNADANDRQQDFCDVTDPYRPRPQFSPAKRGAAAPDWLAGAAATARRVFAPSPTSARYAAATARVPEAPEDTRCVLPTDESSARLPGVPPPRERRLWRQEDVDKSRRHYLRKRGSQVFS